MQHTRSASLTVPEFTPVPRQPRKDGWTPARQRAFIAHLAGTGSVTAATSVVGLSTTQAYRLRAAPGAEEFARAWDAALDCGIAALKALALDRAINGVAVTPIWRGEARETYMRHDNRLMMAMLRHYDRPLPAGTVGGAGAREPKEQVKPQDLAERLFQNAFAQIAEQEQKIWLRARELKTLKFARSQPDGLNYTIGMVEEQIADWQKSVIEYREAASRGPESFRALAATLTDLPWRPLAPRALAELMRVRATLATAAG